MRAPPVSRSSYAPKLRALLQRLDEQGLSEAVRGQRTASLGAVSALAGMGLVSSSSIHAGENTWRLRLTRIGQAIRRLLLAEAARP